jgi:hypothetical protein
MSDALARAEERSFGPAHHNRSADDIFADIAERLQISTTKVRRSAAAA